MMGGCIPPATGRTSSVSEATAVGIATMRGSGGLALLPCAGFLPRPVEALSLEQQEDRVISLLKSNGLQIVSVSEDARKTCKKELGLDGPPALFVMHFEVTDLNTLPGDLLKEVKSRAYRKAAVGACRSGDTAGFTSYRLAVLLN